MPAQNPLHSASRGQKDLEIAEFDLSLWKLATSEHLNVKNNRNNITSRRRDSFEIIKLIEIKNILQIYLIKTIKIKQFELSKIIK